MPPLAPGTAESLWVASVPADARRVLLLGCKSASLVASIKAERSAEVIGVALTDAQAAVTRQSLDQVVVSDPEVLELDFPPGHFDCVLCPELLAHVREPMQLLEQVRRWMTPGGRLVAGFQNLRHHQVVAALLAGRWAPEEGQEAPGPIRFFTRREAEKVLFRAGFALERLQAEPSADLEAWRQSGSPGGVQVGPLRVGGLSPEEAEEFYVARYQLFARPKAVTDFGLTSIVLVTHNQLAYTRACVDSIRLRTDEPYELIFVDNGSSDGTKEYLRCLAGARVIDNGDNRGFPAAANQGIRASTGQQVLLLNNDCVVTTGWLGRLLTALYQHPAVGLAGPCSNCVSGEQQVPVDYENLEGVDGFAWDWSKRQGKVRLNTDRLVGFCLLVRRAVIDRIGLLDERFGVGCFEDDDYCRRALQAGFRAVIARDAFVHHFGGQTFRNSGVDFAALMKQNEQQYRAKWQTPAIIEATAPGVEESMSASPRQFSVRCAPGGGLLLVPRVPLISLCMIVRNNARTIEACLHSIQPWVDEMIVVDTGSTDETPRIAEKLGARLYHFPWCDSFSAARNESVKPARGQWVFWMDSDDTIDEANGRRLREVASQPASPSLLGYVMQVHCPGPGEEGQLDITAVDHVKLFRNRPDLRFEGRIHEQILPAIRRAGGEVAWSDAFVVHSGYDHSPEGQRRKIERDLRLLHLELQEQPQHPFTLFNLGMTYADIGEHERGVDYLRQSIQHSGAGESHLRKAYGLLVFCLCRCGRMSDALTLCAQALQLFPDDIELRFRQGLLFQETGRLAEAAAIYERVLADQPERYFASMDRGIRGFKTRQNLAIVWGELGRWEAAEAQWRQVVEEAPQYRQGWRGLGATLLAQGRHGEAQELADRLQVDSHLRGEGMLLEARRLAALGQHGPSGRLLEQAVQEHPQDEEAWQDLCRYRFEHEEPSRAEEALRQLIALRPQDAAAHHNLAAVLVRRGRLWEAVDAYRESVRLRPRAAETLYQLGNALLRLGRREEAMGAWQRVLELHPEHETARESLHAATGSF